MEEFKLESEYIELCRLLKFKGVLPSGGEVKVAIEQGQVIVDGVVELRKKCKLRVGQVVKYQDSEIHIK